MEELLKKIDDYFIYRQRYRFCGRNNPELFAEIVSFTSFLNENTSLVERVFFIKNRLSEVPTCKNEGCNNKVKFFKNRYVEFCSNSCVNQSSLVKDRIKKANLDKFGVEHSMQSEVVSNKAKSAWKRKSKEELAEIERKRNLSYAKNGGHPLRRPEVVKKVIESKKPKMTEILSKMRQTNISRHGVNYYTQASDFQQKCKDTYQRKYGADSHMQVATIRNKITKTNLQRYGVENANQNTNVREKARATNQERYGKNFGCEFVLDDEVKRKLDNADWLREQHHVLKKSLLTISKELGVGDCTVGRRMKQFGIPLINFESSESERCLADFVSSLGFTVTRNDRNLIFPLELDIVIEEKKIAIEYCGLFWHSEEHKPNNYHLGKLNQCNQAGYRLITIFEDEWIHKQELVKSKLKAILGKDDREKIFARKCKALEVSSMDAKTFFDVNHIQGHTNATIYLSLIFNHEKVAMVSLKKTNDVWELVRYATSKNVIGGFSKLLTYFKRNFDWKEITTFADRRWSEGNLYLKNGFELVDTTKPNYSYVKGTERFHKFNFRKSRIQSRFKNIFDPTLSEREMSDKAGFLRIYDCGLLKYKIRNTQRENKQLCLTF